ncbi:hypothetical protein ACFL0L_01580 [Patescibacteria group bacterium]
MQIADNKKLKKHPLDYAIKSSRVIATIILFYGFMMGLAIGFFGIPLNITVYGTSISGFIPYLIAIVIAVASFILYPILLKKKYPGIKTNIYTIGKLKTHVGLLTLIAGGAGFVLALWAYILLFIKTSDNTSINEFLYYPNYATKIAFIPIIASVYFSFLKKIISHSLKAIELVFLVFSTILLIMVAAFISFVGISNSMIENWWLLIPDLIAGGSSYTFAMFFLLKFRPTENIQSSST